jgi:hypothetical protein
VSQVLAKGRFDNPALLAILGGRQVMIESPLIQEIVAETIQGTLLRVLRGRFGDVPSDVERLLRGVTKEKTLSDLSEYAGACPSMEAFRERLLS